jgi:hypothetical protein
MVTKVKKLPLPSGQKSAKLPASPAKESMLFFASEYISSLDLEMKSTSISIKAMCSISSLWSE